MLLTRTFPVTKNTHVNPRLIRTTVLGSRYNDVDCLLTNCCYVENCFRMLVDICLSIRTCYGLQFWVLVTMTSTVYLPKLLQCWQLFSDDSRHLFISHCLFPDVSSLWNNKHHTHHELNHYKHIKVRTFPVLLVETYLLNNRVSRWHPMTCETHHTPVCLQVGTPYSICSLSVGVYC